MPDIVIKKTTGRGWWWRIRTEVKFSLTTCRPDAGRGGRSTCEERGGRAWPVGVGPGRGLRRRRRLEGGGVALGGGTGPVPRGPPRPIGPEPSGPAEPARSRLQGEGGRGAGTGQAAAGAVSLSLSFLLGRRAGRRGAPAAAG